MIVVNNRKADIRKAIKTTISESCCEKLTRSMDDRLLAAIEKSHFNKGFAICFIIGVDQFL